jgi:hypothetical protein
VAGSLADLLSALPNDDGRAEILRLAYEVRQTPPASQAEQQRLNEMVDRLRWHFRAARYGVPAHAELRQMIDAHFR